MNQAIELLDKEHKFILTAIEKADALFNSVISGDSDISGMKKFIEFFRNYTDKYHHQKEEEILFPEMSKRNELLEDGVIKEMFENHEDFREMMRNIESEIDNNNVDSAYKLFNEYSEALKDHIAVEDDEVFQMAESLMSDDEMDNIYFRFLDNDRELGDKEKSDMEEWIK